MLVNKTYRRRRSFLKGREWTLLDSDEWTILERDEWTFLERGEWTTPVGYTPPHSQQTPDNH
jgi:hypothetical protein